MQEFVRLLLILVIVLVALLIVVLFVSAVARRALHAIRFRRLDRQRPYYRGQIQGLMDAGAVSRRLYLFKARPGSLKWQAVENALFDLLGEAPYAGAAKELFIGLGYVEHYEKRLSRGSHIDRASAADKLGRMRSERSVGRIADLFDSGSVELASVGIRALSKIGTMKALEAVLGKLPRLIDGALAAQKTLTAFLLNFGPPAAARLVGYGWHSDRPAVLAVVLEVLARLRAPEAVPLAAARLGSESAEIRAKALRVIAASPEAGGVVDWTKVAGLLGDEVWFVRLHAAKAGKFDVMVFPSIVESEGSVKDVIDIDGYLRKRGVDTVFLREGVDTSTPTGALYRNIICSVAEFEGRLIYEWLSKGSVRRHPAGRAEVEGTIRA